MKLKYSLLLLVPVIVMASEAEHSGSTDIIERTINFVIFAAILYYLIADKIKAYFAGRTAGIANQLTEIQDKLKASKDAKDAALKEVEKAKEKAKDLVNVAKEEAKLMGAKIAKDADLEIANLEKSLEDRMHVEEKKMTKNVVSEVIDEVFQDGKIELNNDDFLNIIKKKVA